MRKLIDRRSFPHEVVPVLDTGTDTHSRRRKRRAVVRAIPFVFVGIVALFVFGYIFEATFPFGGVRSGGAIRASTQKAEDEIIGQQLQGATSRHEEQWTSSPPVPPATKRTTTSTAPAASTTGTETTKASALSGAPPSTLHPVSSTLEAPDPLHTPNTQPTFELLSSSQLPAPHSATTVHGTKANNATHRVTKDPYSTLSPPCGPVRSSPTPQVTKRPQLQETRGEYLPEEAQRLPGLQIQRRTFTPAELLARFGDTDIVYSFVNGSEVNHEYRKAMVKYCIGTILLAENASYVMGPSFLVPTPDPAELPSRATASAQGTRSHSLLRSDDCTRAFFKGGLDRIHTVRDFLHAAEAAARSGVDNRDRETDELRHSLRSLEQHVRWHRGRVVMVSPGHHPTWVDGAKNFLAGLCGDAHVQALRSSGTHLRVTTVHQDAVMPTHARLTVNTNTIEQQLWRVRNMTAVHVYMNDDYFVNRDVAITDLFNEYGGTIVRTESGAIAGASTGNESLSTWAEGVLNTNFFVTDELDLQHEDEVPSAVVRLWQQQDGALTQWDVEAVGEGKEPLPAVKGPDPRNAMWIMLDYAETSPPRSIAVPRVDTAADVVAAYSRLTFGTLRPHFYAAHAPYVYCTNMLRYLALRYQREFAQSMFLRPLRSATDLYVPFLYNAFIMARPWQASPRFPAYLTLRQQLKERKWRAVPLSATPIPEELETNGTAGVGNGPQNMEASSHPPPKHTPGVSVVEKRISVAPIELNNCDGCAPATMLVGPEKSEYLFGKFSDDLRANAEFIRQVHEAKPLFFNVNAGLTTPKAADQLRAFLHDLFPTPLFLESSPGVNADLSRLFDDLMALPVVCVVSYEEGVCPLVRSLALAFAGHHRGGVHVQVQRYGFGEVDATMAEVRQDLRYAQQSAMTAVACTYATHVTVRQSRRGESLSALARRVLDGADEVGAGGVELPATCGGGGAGLRVRGFVVDARTRGVPVRSAAALRDALAAPAQTLSLEDFRAVAVGPSERDVVLVVSREDADAKAVHWVNGASESDLLVTYPLPVEAYEDMGAEVRWSKP